MRIIAAVLALVMALLFAGPVVAREKPVRPDPPTFELPPRTK